jgi:hypothetical protein
MSNPSSDPTNLDQLDEQLVAYLDGELEPQAAREIENLLAGDEYARRRLNQLASSWDMLDQLPRATVDDLFSRTTVEMVALAAEEEVVQAQAKDPVRRRRRWLEAGIATLAAAIIGFVVVVLAVPDQNDLLLRDLPVVKNLELYRDAGNLDLLKQFQAANLFADNSATGSFGTSQRDPQSTVAASNGATIIPASLTERHAWVESLSPTDKIDLRDDFEKFSALPPKQQQALRQFDKQLSEDPNNAQLRRIMQRYYDWLKTLTSVDRANVLDETNATDQIKLIRQLRQGQMNQYLTWLDPGLNLLRDRDSAAVLQWMREFADSHEAELTALLPDQKHPDGQKSDERRRRRPLMGLAWQQWWSPSATSTPPVTSTDIHALHSMLSPEKQQQLDSQTELNEQTALIRRWIQTAFAEFRELAAQGFGRWGGLPNQDRLNRFEQQLSPEEKKELAGLTGPEHMRKLMELFQNHRAADAQKASAPSHQSADSSTSAAKSKPSDDAKSPPPE